VLKNDTPVIQGCFMLKDKLFILVGTFYIYGMDKINSAGIIAVLTSKLRY